MQTDTPCTTLTLLQSGALWKLTVRCSTVYPDEATKFKHISNHENTHRHISSPWTGDPAVIFEIFWLQFHVWVSASPLFWRFETSNTVTLQPKSNNNKNIPTNIVASTCWPVFFFYNARTILCMVSFFTHMLQRGKIHAEGKQWSSWKSKPFFVGRKDGLGGAAFQSSLSIALLFVPAFNKEINIFINRKNSSAKLKIKLKRTKWTWISSTQVPIKCNHLPLYLFSRDMLPYKRKKIAYQHL